MSKTRDFKTNCPRCRSKQRAMPAGVIKETGERAQKCMRCGTKLPVDIFGSK